MSKSVTIYLHENKQEKFLRKTGKLLSEMKQRIEAYEKINFVFSEVKAKLAGAQVRLFEQKSMISGLQKRNAELLAENSILVRYKFNSM